MIQWDILVIGASALVWMFFEFDHQKRFKDLEERIEDLEERI